MFDYSRKQDKFQDFIDTPFKTRIYYHIFLNGDDHMDIKINMPDGAKNIIKVLKDQGFEAYVVGGCVRDALLGRDAHDWDITTSAKPDEIKKIFKKTIDTGIKHGTVTVLMGDAYEVTTYRLDGEYTDHRRPEEVTFTTKLSEDLLRRDFTINAMAYNDEEGLVDLYDGMGDIKRKVIRCVGVAENRFDEDALRILRAVRFSAQLGFSIDPDTKLAIESKRKFLKDISAERIREELTKLICSPHPERLLDAASLGITAIVLPEFDSMLAMEQNNPHHIYTVGMHAMKAVEAQVDMDVVEPAMRWGMLLHDIGKLYCKTTDEAGVDHFKGHPQEGLAPAREILSRLKFDNATIDRVLRIVLWHDLGLSGDLTKKALRRAINKMGGAEHIPDILVARKCDALAQNPAYLNDSLSAIDRFKAMYEEIKAADDCLSLKDLTVNGSDLIAAGITPGKEIGRILNEMLADVLEEPEHNEKEYLMEKYVR